MVRELRQRAGIEYPSPSESVSSLPLTTQITDSHSNSSVTAPASSVILHGASKANDHPQSTATANDIDVLRRSLATKCLNKAKRDKTITKEQWKFARKFVESDRDIPNENFRELLPDPHSFDMEENSFALDVVDEVELASE